MGCSSTERKYDTKFKMYTRFHSLMKVPVSKYIQVIKRFIHSAASMLQIYKEFRHHSSANDTHFQK
jgi:hypothetical protein